ncbi:MAG: hypothetical protein ABF624_00070 [Liquorilactobacillus ghanensis]|uniref:hypothetical protein n=1 Tax=Liquorilactobacillus ghanensis TaxID=399370 RepID=UPI0039E9238B
MFKTYRQLAKEFEQDAKRNQEKMQSMNEDYLKMKADNERIMNDMNKVFERHGVYHV